MIEMKTIEIPFGLLGMLSAGDSVVIDEIKDPITIVQVNEPKWDFVRKMLIIQYMYENNKGKTIFSIGGSE